MNEKELREIKRRFRPEKSNIPKIVGCFVNGNGQIVEKICQPMGSSDSVLSEKLLSAMKKTLSGSLGTNLTDMPFSTKQVLESPQHKLLMKLVKSGLSDEDALSEFYGKVIESVNLDGNYVILLANDIYDVFKYGEDGEKADSSETFSYIVAAICPVKSMSEALSFEEGEGVFRLFSASSILKSAELGFMFPTFEDRKTNIYNALFYTRSLSDSYSAFAESVFASEPPMPPARQKATFSECLTDALSEECSFEVIRSVHSQISEMVTAHKESRDPEPLLLTKATVKSVLADCGIAEEKLERLGEALDESFGQGAELAPKNIVAVNKFEVKTPEVSIKVDPEHRDLVSTQIINNVKYVMIRADGGVEVNGININIDGE